MKLYVDVDSGVVGHVYDLRVIETDALDEGAKKAIEHAFTAGVDATSYWPSIGREFGTRV